MSAVKGIQITTADNAALVGSIWIIDGETQQARCVAAKAGFEADQVVAIDELGTYESRELPLEQPPRIEGGQHLNVNVLNQGALQNLMAAHERVAQGTASNEDLELIEENANMTIRVSGYAVRFNALTLEQQKDVVTRTFTGSL